MAVLDRTQCKGTATAAIGIGTGGTLEDARHRAVGSPYPRAGRRWDTAYPPWLGMTARPRGAGRGTTVAAHWAKRTPT